MRSHTAVIVSRVHATKEAIHLLSLKLKRIELLAADLLKRERIVCLALITFVLAMFGLLALPRPLEVFQSAAYSGLNFSSPAFYPCQPPPPQWSLVFF